MNKPVIRSCFGNVMGQSTCNTTAIGAYHIQYINNGEAFRLQLIRDDCPERQQLFAPRTTFVRQRPLTQPPYNWPYLDPLADSVAGISLYRAYELLKGKPSVPVVMGVLDSGVDITHEDLRDVIWTNPKEIPDNNLDDDKNGYIDDRNGWNFMGANDGTTYEYDQPEITQTYLVLKNKYDTIDPAKLSSGEKRQYNTYLIAKKQFLPTIPGQPVQIQSFCRHHKFLAGSSSNSGSITPCSYFSRGHPGCWCWSRHCSKHHPNAASRCLPAPIWPF